MPGDSELREAPGLRGECASDADAADILAGPGAGSPTVTGSAPGLVTPGRDGPGPRDRATVAAAAHSGTAHRGTAGRH